MPVHIQSAAVLTSSGQQIGDEDVPVLMKEDTCTKRNPVDLCFAKSEPVDPRLAGSVRTLESRCDRVDEQLSKVHKDISDLQARISEKQGDAQMVHPNASAPNLVSSAVSGPEAEQETTKSEEGDGWSPRDTLEVQVQHVRTSVRTSVFTDGYTFQPNVWDLALFIGYPQIGLGGSIFAAILLVANIVLQTLLIIIINESFTEASINSETVSDMRRWRVFFGHSWDLVDKLTFEPLASRICKHDASVPYAAGVVRVLDDISEYMPSENDYDSANPLFGHLVPHMEEIGMILCLLAIVIWLLEIVVAFDEIWQLGIAVKQLPRTSTRRLSIQFHHDAQESATLQSLSYGRKCWCLLLVAIQFWVIFIIGVIGVAYMIYTASMRDLLLNCSALAIVIQVDERLYAALAPRMAKNLIQQMSPLARQKTSVYAGLGWETLFFTANIVSTVIIAILPLTDSLHDLRATREEICGGNKQFVAVRDSVGIINAGDTSQLIDIEST